MDSISTSEKFFHSLFISFLLADDLDNGNGYGVHHHRSGRIAQPHAQKTRWNNESQDDLVAVCACIPDYT